MTAQTLVTASMHSRMTLLVSEGYGSHDDIKLAACLLVNSYSATQDWLASWCSLVPRPLLPSLS